MPNLGSRLLHPRRVAPQVVPRRKKSAMPVVVEADLADSLSGMLDACFGKDGNFTVFVEEEIGDSGAGKLTEFKVWASLLAQRSPVFESMTSREEFEECRQAQVVIRDFSAKAVEAFLRFLYCGRLETSVGTLVEVAAIADKCQVPSLHSQCMEAVRENLTPEQACEVFASADKFRVAALRVEALEMICAEPEKALRRRPSVRPEMLETILSLCSLCTQKSTFRSLLRGWDKAGEELPMPAVSEAVQPGTFRTDVLYDLWDRYDRSGKQGSFVGYWVVVVLGPGQAGMDLEKLARNNCYNMYQKGWVMWMLPHAQVHLTGFHFSRAIPSSVSLRILCSQDGAAWHCAVESQEQDIEAGATLACDEPQKSVKWFRLEVLNGEFDSEFCIHGISQTDLLSVN
ncbi:mel-26 [Symbiodinium natans]|uniref:Mel-26 protein n=1 Tax=Symbiodinium natans TaxID=878477 RepID=A0A812I5C6_9DINO|nr:mel-26 [Symbiodinium natans]